MGGVTIYIYVDDFLGLQSYLPCLRMNRIQVVLDWARIDSESLFFESEMQPKHRPTDYT